MKTLLPPVKPRVLLFDIDNTLYHHTEYIATQNSSQIDRFARYRNISPKEAEAAVDSARSRLTEAEGRRPSLANTLDSLGVPISMSVVWRTEEIHPERYLQRDEPLQRMIATLYDSYRLAALTNNPREVGQRTLKCLGIADYFEHVTGLDSSGASKPSWAPFQHALDTLSTDISRTIMIGDRYDVDLDPFVTRGGFGILVTNREELLSVADILREAYGISLRH